MDDLGERLGALEATLRVEVRALHALVDQQVQAINGELWRLRESVRLTDERMREHLHRVDQLLEHRLEDLKKDLVREMANRVAFSDRVAWIIVSTILIGALSAMAAFVFSVGQESRRTLTLPTTPPTKQQHERNF